MKSIPDASRVVAEVAYALPNVQELREVSLPRGAKLRDAVQASGLVEDYPAIDLETGAFGVFGRGRPLSSELCSGDRVEIYRPLSSDPGKLRQKRAARAL